MIPASLLENNNVPTVYVPSLSHLGFRRFKLLSIS